MSFAADRTDQENRNITVREAADAAIACWNYYACKRLSPKKRNEVFTALNKILPQARSYKPSLPRKYFKKGVKK